MINLATRQNGDSCPVCLTGTITVAEEPTTEHGADTKVTRSCSGCSEALTYFE